MIAHVYHDGSIGEEHEVGDRVETICDLWVDCSGNPIPIGTKGIVKWIKPYDKSSTYHTCFCYVSLEEYGTESKLNSYFKSLEKPRKTINET